MHTWDSRAFGMLPGGAFVATVDPHHLSQKKKNRKEKKEKMWYRPCPSARWYEQPARTEKDAIRIASCILYIFLDICMPGGDDF
jgi:hypothetical protein